jgi:GrpB-like predicted nucleotidyltransferase (UPF0157 family)
MPLPIKVRLVPHDLRWAELAAAEAARIFTATDHTFLAIHHIGSTAIPGIVAKPILDLLPVAKNMAQLDTARAAIESLGYTWHGEYGLQGRRYCKLDDAVTGERRIQLHCYVEGNPAITRHLAFRDWLRERPELAAEYEREKLRCAALYPGDSHAYSECKSNWIRRIELEIKPASIKAKHLAAAADGSVDT